MAAGSEGGEKSYQFACSLKELERLGRKRITVEERVVVLFHVKGQVYAIDHFCYRKFIYEPFVHDIIMLACAILGSHRCWRST